jgi:hypothetical protein
MIDLTQNSGSVIVVESNDYDEFWLIPPGGLVISKETRGYNRGTKLDWHSSMLHRTRHWTDDESLRER